MTSTLGSGPHAVVCLHGWFGHGGDWGPWTDVLDTTDFTWYFPDYRGYGARRDEPTGHTLDDVAADILPVVTEAAGGHERVSLLGHSMGGAYAQYVMQRTETPIAAFIGLSPVPTSGTPLPPDQRAFFESAGSQVAARRGIIDITTGSRLSAHWLDRMADATRQNSTDEAVAAYFTTWADCDFHDDLGRVATPALVLVGATDPAITTAVMDATYASTFENLTVVEFPDAGHYPMFECPVRLATEIENFLRSV